MPAQEEIMLFMRYVSGFATLVPGERIKVLFINQPLDHLRPTSQTCFKILHIPRGYQSFTHLKSNLTKYIISQDLWAIQDMGDAV